MSVMSDLDAELKLVQGVFGRQPLAQWLNSLFGKTEDLMGEINCQTYRFLSKSEMLEALELDENDLRLMAHIGARLQLIASNIDSRTAPKFKLVGHPQSR